MELASSHWYIFGLMNKTIELIFLHYSTILDLEYKIKMDTVFCPWQIFFYKKASLEEKNGKFVFCHI